MRRFSVYQRGHTGLALFGVDERLGQLEVLEPTREHRPVCRHQRVYVGLDAARRCLDCGADLEG